MNIGKLKAKWRIIFGILSGKYKHGFLVTIDRNNLKSLIENKDFDVKINFFGLQGFLVTKMIQSISNSKRDTDVMLEEMHYESQFEEWKKKNR